MPFSESLAGRIRDALLRSRGVEEKKMFGGIGFHLKGWFVVEPDGVENDDQLAEGAATMLPPTKEEIEKLLAVAPGYGITILLPGH
jgi:hypothetical protein